MPDHNKLLWANIGHETTTNGFVKFPADAPIFVQHGPCPVRFLMEIGKRPNPEKRFCALYLYAGFVHPSRERGPRVRSEGCPKVDRKWPHKTLL